MPFSPFSNSKQLSWNQYYYVMTSIAYPLKNTFANKVSKIVDDAPSPGKGKKQTLAPGAGFAKTQYMQKKKILVADDDPAIIDVLTLMLENDGYEVYTSGNSKTIPDAKNIRPHLILLDILMSGMNGYDICRELKSQAPTRAIPVIMVSASKDASEIALAAGADDLIVKPFEMLSLLQKVAAYTAT